jgi:hypothetical protein
MQVGPAQADHTISAKDEAVDDKCTLQRDASLRATSWHSGLTNRLTMMTL